MAKRKLEASCEPPKLLCGECQAIAFVNARVLDVERGSLSEAGQTVRVLGDTIAAVGAEVRPQAGDRIIEAGGMTLMPGLIDMHVHVTAWSANFSMLTRQATSYTTMRASHILRGMLLRGFTSVRDAGGADFGLAQAVEENLIEGPKIFFCGHALSQTGGHGDQRGPGENAEPCTCMHGLGVVCDGVAQMRKACRDEIRKGATQIKLMVSGGVASPCDRIDSTQLALDEITAAVEEAEAANIPVMAHAYTARAIKRALQCGVRSIEHGNLLDESCLGLFLEKGAFLVPTLASYQALASEGLANGMPKDQVAKVSQVLDAGVRALGLAHRAGVKICYATDLLGDMHRHQLTGLAMHAAVQPNADVLRAATCTAAELLGLLGRLGVVRAGARADLLLVDGNPLADLSVLLEPELRLKVVMKGGVLHKHV
uniref:Amidohydrolase-related domain-containing protein n=1 Tax=Alexandrium monilatum TaxID=311494 RepID=A0A7S4QG34_9DINO